MSPKTIWPIGFFVLCCSFGLSQPAAAEGPPQLLPDASDFHLTLAEDPHSTLPLGASCAGEAGLTLTCRAFIVTLENASKDDTVRISWANCNGPAIRIDRKEPHSSSGWWPVSQKQGKNCSPLSWSNLRLKPGEKTNYATRLIAPDRYADALAPGSYTLRAEWLLFGCTEEPDGKDCLVPLHAADKLDRPSAFDWQDPVAVTSNEVTVESPPLPDLGTPKFSLDVRIRPGPPGNNIRNGASVDCTGQANTSIDCVVFHYTIRNVTGRAVRNGTFSCSDRPLTWEYEAEDGKWAPAPRRMDVPQVCLSNVYGETPFLPDGISEGEFTLSSISALYDMTRFREAGEYIFRFTFWPNACIASPDATFCLTWPKQQQAALSREISVRVSAASPPSRQ